MEVGLLLFRLSLSKHALPIWKDAYVDNHDNRIYIVKRDRRQASTRVDGIFHVCLAANSNWHNEKDRIDV